MLFNRLPFLAPVKKASPITQSRCLLNDKILNLLAGSDLRTSDSKKYSLAKSQLRLPQYLLY